MMDTVLNLGITDEVEEALAELSGDRAFARSTHCRFIHQFGQTVLGADLDEPGDDATPSRVRQEVEDDTDEAVPTDPHEQLRAVIKTVFGSWSSRRAKAYRKHWGIPEDGGTAVIVQAMVFGNLGEDSGTGVLFSRNPLSGDPEPYGEWLPRGQGEDVVSGTHDPEPLTALAERMPAVHARLLEAAALLEREHGDVQDIEFTIQGGELFLLQTRSAKRSPLAAVRAAVDLADEGTIGREEAVRRVSAEQLASVLAPHLADDTTADAEVLARGIAACPGVASGVAVGDSDAACEADGDVVLTRPTTSPEDVSGHDRRPRRGHRARRLDLARRRRHPRPRPAERGRGRRGGNGGDGRPRADRRRLGRRRLRRRAGDRGRRPGHGAGPLGADRVGT